MSPSIPMLERVSKAVHTARNDAPYPWGHADPDHCLLSKHIARAVLKSLIPPSEEMVAAMVAAIFDAGEMPNAPDSLKAAFTAAIQAVLTEGEGT